MRGRRFSQEQIAAAGERARQALLKKFGARPALLPDAPAALIDLYLVQTHDTVSMLDQAKQLGLSPGGVKRRRARLAAAGRIDPADRAAHRPFGDDEIAAVRRLYVQGYSVESIGAMRQISEHRVWRMLNTGPRPERPMFYTRGDVQRLFSASASTIDAWLARGWLTPAKSQPNNPRSHHRWTRADLADFVRLRAAWPAYAASQITDPELRRLAEAARAESGGEWVSYKELASRLGVAYTTLKNWTYRYGYLRDVETTSYGPASYIWQPRGTPAPAIPAQLQAYYQRRAA